MVVKKELDFDDELLQMSQIPTELAILPVNDAVVFPLMMVPLLASAKPYTYHVPSRSPWT